MLGTVVQIIAWDPVAGATVTLQAGSHDIQDVCHLSGTLWWPAIAKLPTLRYDLFDGAFAGQITAPSSSLKLQTEPWPDFGRYSFADARLRLWTGEIGSAWAGWTLRFDGRVTSQPAVEGGAATIDFAVDDRWLDTALFATYAGTTGLEGPAELKGQVKPFAAGAPRYVAGKLIDSVNSVFQVSGYGAIVGFAATLERLARFGAPIADYPTYAALLAATIPAAKWATCNQQGLARFGAPPTGQVSFLVIGDGGVGASPRVGRLVRRLAAMSGGAGKVDDASLDALDAARPYPVSLYADEQTTARELIQRLAASVNAVAGVSWLGKLFLLPVALGNAQLTLAADGSALPPVRSVEQIAIDAPFKRIAITAERAWTVHALADIAFTAPLVERGSFDPAAIYREGNIVDGADGSRWLYIATTPAAGAPLIDGTTWKRLAVPASVIPAGTVIGGTADPATGVVSGGLPVTTVIDRANDVASSRDAINAALGAAHETLSDALGGAMAEIGAATTAIDGAQAAIDGALGQVSATLADALGGAMGQLNTAIITQLQAVLLAETRNARAEALMHLNAIDIGTLLVQEIKQRLDGEDATAETFSLLGAKNSTGTSFILDTDKVKVSPTESLAQRFTSISASVDGEAETRAAAVTRLDQADADEATARAQAIQQVEASIDGEAETRAAAVTRLDQADADEATARAQAIQQVQASIDSEVETRAAAVTRLDQADADEATARAQAIQQVEASIDSEVETRAAAVTRLDQADADEATARAQAIQQVEASIGNEVETRAAAVVSLQQAQVDGDKALAEQLVRLGVLSADKAAFILNGATTRIDSSTTLAQQFANLTIAPGKSNTAAANDITTAWQAGDAAAASRLIALETTGTIRSFLSNANFANYPAATGIPPMWINGANGAATTSRTAGETGLGSALLMRGLAGTGTHISQPSAAGAVKQGDWIVIEAIVRLVAGELTGGGVQCNITNAGGSGVAYPQINFAASLNDAGVPIGAGTVGTVYRFSRLYQVTAAAADALRVFAMSHYNDFGSLTNENQLAWYLCNARPASPLEIARGKADTAMGATASSVQLLMSSLAGLEANAVLAVSVNGAITGFIVNGQDRSFIVEAEHFGIRNGTSDELIFEAVAGKVRVKNLYIGDQNITAANLAPSSAQKVSYARLTSDLVIGYGG